MIDRLGRDNLAEALRHLAAGQISNDQYESRVYENGVPRQSKDRAVEEIFDESWYLYSDLHEYRLMGKYRLRRDARMEVARWILFLKSDLPYEWPCWPRLSLMFGNILTLGLLAPLVRRWFRRFGDSDVWPFILRVDYEKCLKVPPYFAGSSTSLSTRNP